MVDAPRAGLAEQLDLRARDLAGVSTPAERVVDVVVDVGDAVDDADDFALQGLRLRPGRCG